MSLRGRFLAYLIVLHVIFAGLAVYLLSRHRVWLFAVEALFVISLAVGVKLSRDTFRTLGFARHGAVLIKDQEFTSRFLEVNQPEVDELIGVYNLMVDHLRAERTRLQEQQQFLAQIVRASPSGIVILDFDGRVAEVNPSAERLLAQPAATLIGRGLAEIRSPLAEALTSLQSGEARIVGLSGARRVRCQRGAFVDRGFHREFLFIEELTEELRRFEKAAYEKLIRVMSHEVNNTIGASNSLLHSCLTFANRLEPDARPDFQRALRIVIERTDELNGFMRSFADVVRLPPPVKRQAEILPMLEDIVRLVSASPEGSRVTWLWDVADPTVRAMMDRSQMQHALLNVVKNAVEAVDGDGRVRIQVARQNGRATVVVEDSGPGIEPEAQANLFTPFFSTKPGGQGIGLTLVQEILSGHGFEYSLEGPPGGPTRFTVVMS
jgi:two-component system, NtrC family, nitrogen regulation sensor histidine kinase NtrY